MAATKIPCPEKLVVSKRNIGQIFVDKYFGTENVAYWLNPLNYPQKATKARCTALPLPTFHVLEDIFNSQLQRFRNNLRLYYVSSHT
jgi:hypothetical protein